MAKYNGLEIIESHEFSVIIYDLGAWKFLMINQFYLFKYEYIYQVMLI